MEIRGHRRATAKNHIERAALENAPTAQVKKSPVVPAERIEAASAEPHDLFVSAEEPGWASQSDQQAVQVEINSDLDAEIAAEAGKDRNANGDADFSIPKFEKGGNAAIHSTGQKSSPTDDAAQLTRRLVAAVSQFEVRQILVEAGKSMASLRAMAMSGEARIAKAAQSCIKKLEKLISRAQRKIKDLNKEDSLKTAQAQAESRKQMLRAEQIKEELRKRVRERTVREKGYLTEREQDIAGLGNATPGREQTKLDAASEAEIAVRAEAMAAAEVSAPGGANAAGAELAGEAGGGAQGEVSSGSEAGGAEVSGAEGGETQG